MRCDLSATSGHHPFVNLLGIIDDFRNGAIEAKEAVRQPERITCVAERTHAAHEIGPTAPDNYVKRRRSIAAEVFAQSIADGTEGIVYIGIVGFAADDEQDIGLR